MDAYVAGMTWGWVGVRGSWDTPAAAESMETMAATTAINWVALTFSALQDTAQSTQIHWQDAPTVTDREVLAEIAPCARAGAQGLPETGGQLR